MFRFGLNHHQGACKLPDDGLVKTETCKSICYIFSLKFLCFRTNLLCIGWSNKNINSYCFLTATMIMRTCLRVMLYLHVMVTASVRKEL
jgi:hypothetical protein